MNGQNKRHKYISITDYDLLSKKILKEKQQQIKVLRKIIKSIQQSIAIDKAIQQMSSIELQQGEKNENTNL